MNEGDAEKGGAPVFNRDLEGGAELSKKAVVDSLQADVKTLTGFDTTLDPAKMAESITKAVGEYANKEKIDKLKHAIAQASAAEKAFNAEADASAFTSLQENMAAAAKKLEVLVAAYQGAKEEMAAAGDTLIQQLSKGGSKKGKDQATAVLFLTDADRFLAQATNAISTGKNQQENAKRAAGDRQKLRGTSENLEGGPGNLTQKYWTAEKFEKKGVLWDSKEFRLHPHNVTFSGDVPGEFGDVTQGGEGTVEGAGGTGDVMAMSLARLEKAKAEVERLRTQVQAQLGLGGPGINA